MFDKKNKIELLAPAKNKNTAFIAINAGADAVYIGYQKFGARSAAGNSIEDIKEVVDYAHKFRVRVYVTLNTIFTDAEIPLVVGLIHNFKNINVDGIIIQDMGLLEYDLPDIPIIASTQCHNNTLEKIDFLEKTGFARVILPREFSLEQIKDISSKTNVELESFIHGALCVSYSGQCYLSHAIGGRSANRGECAQPCRKKYSLKDSSGKYIAKDKYLLSLKDFNLSNHIKDMIIAGITSFKIEGRLKDDSYIKNVVSYYRRLLDNVLEELGMQKTSVGSINIGFEPDLCKTFNRGYTNYFIENRSKDISAMDYSKSLGEEIACVSNVCKNSFQLNKKVLLSSGDGICFFSNGELKGTKINSLKGGNIIPNSMQGIVRGLKIYRNFDKAFSDELELNNLTRKIDVSFEVVEDKTIEKIVFRVKDFDGNKAEIIFDNDFKVANNKDKALENIKRQLFKLGDTEFYAKTIEINLLEVPFLPISQLNQIRRDLVFELCKSRVAAYSSNLKTFKNTVVKYPYKELNFEANIYNMSAKSFYEKRDCVVCEMAAETFKNLENKKVMTTKHCLRYLFDLCPKQGDKLKEYAEPLILVDEYKKEYRLDFDCKSCEMHIYY